MNNDLQQLNRQACIDLVYVQRPMPTLEMPCASQLFAEEAVLQRPVVSHCMDVLPSRCLSAAPKRPHDTTFAHQYPGRNAWSRHRKRA
jgi:hypothetical protein